MQPATTIPTPVYQGDFCQFYSYTFTGLDLSAAAGWGNWRGVWRPTIGALTEIDLAVDITYASTGTLTMSATSDQTATMGSGGVFDVKATDATGRVQTFIFGTTELHLRVAL